MTDWTNQEREDYEPFSELRIERERKGEKSRRKLWKVNGRTGLRDFNGPFEW